MNISVTYVLRNVKHHPVELAFPDQGPETPSNALHILPPHTHIAPAPTPTPHTHIESFGCVHRSCLVMKDYGQ